MTLAGGLDTHTSGEVYVDGTALSDLSPAQLSQLRRRSLGYVFQDLNLVPALTAGRVVAIPGALTTDGAGFSVTRQEL